MESVFLSTPSAEIKTNMKCLTCNIRGDFWIMFSFCFRMFHSSRVLTKILSVQYNINNLSWKPRTGFTNINTASSHRWDSVMNVIIEWNGFWVNTAEGVIAAWTFIIISFSISVLTNDSISQEDKKCYSVNSAIERELHFLLCLFVFQSFFFVCLLIFNTAEKQKGVRIECSRAIVGWWLNQKRKYSVLLFNLLMMNYLAFSVPLKTLNSSYSEMSK